MCLHVCREALLCDDCLAGHKSLDDGGMAVLSSQVQCSVSLLVFHINTGPLWEEEKRKG